ncbi:unnamed protein product, partial [Mesorhabditis belari]|uniref:dTCF n=1 Tax=Mesorhabditis belari TaxID=2138241 RepID=A0AAF3EAP3_9BILA
MQTEEGTDEVKVFRRQVEDSDETAPESSERLDAVKKEAAIETELEQRSNPAEPFGKSGAFKETFPSPYASPSFPPLGFPFPLGGLPGFGVTGSLSPYFFPTLMGMSQTQQLLAQRAFQTPSIGPLMGSYSPNYNPALLAMQQTFQLGSPGSPLTAFQKQHAAGQVPLTSNLRPGALNQMTNVRVPPYNVATGSQSQTTTPKRKERKRSPHIKKPLNAFMWFMKENRPKLMAELGFKEKQSAELNKELGKRWHELNKEAQEKYFVLAKKDKEDHQQRYPGWSARENYAIHKKKKRKREKTEDINEAKKCRARFGVDRQDLWCQYCRRKKKCQFTGGGGGEVSRSSSSTEPSLPGDVTHLLLNSENDDIKMPFRIKNEDVNYESESDTDGEEMDEDLDMDDPTLTAHELERVNTDQL